MESHWEQPENVNLVAEDGGMRGSQASHPHLKFWKGRRVTALVQQWVLSRVIDLGNLLLQIGVVLEEGTEVRVVGFAEGADVSDGTKIRDYEEVTLEGGATTLNRYECILLPKYQVVVNLSGDVHQMKNQ